MSEWFEALSGLQQTLFLIAVFSTTVFLLQLAATLTGIGGDEADLDAIADGSPMDLDEHSLVSMNLWGFHPSIFETIRSMFVDFVANNQEDPRAEFYIPLVVNHLIRSGAVKLKVLSSDEKWYGVTYQEDKETVQNAFHQFAAEGKYPSNLWA